CSMFTFHFAMLVFPTYSLKSKHQLPLRLSDDWHRSTDTSSATSWRGREPGPSGWTRCEVARTASDTRANRRSSHRPETSGCHRRWPTGADHGSATCARSDLSSRGACGVDFSSSGVPSLDLIHRLEPL